MIYLPTVEEARRLRKKATRGEWITSETRLHPKLEWATFEIETANGAACVADMTGPLGGMADANAHLIATAVNAFVPMAERIAELERKLAEQVPPARHCPFTGREFFMVLEHPERGPVPTYGGPFDSYTVPEPDEDGSLRCERYDHDAGGWADGGEPTGQGVFPDSSEWIQDPERVAELERENAELQSEVKSLRRTAKRLRVKWLREKEAWHWSESAACLASGGDLERADYHERRAGRFADVADRIEAQDARRGEP